MISVLHPDKNSATSGIQEALNKLGGTGGMVQLGAGDYVVHQSVRIPSLTALAGCGPATRIVLADGAGRPQEETHVITNGEYDSSGIVVRDLSIDGNYKNQLWGPKDLGGAGLAFNGSDSVIVERLVVKHTWRHGIWFLNGSGFQVSNCNVHTVGCSNISIGGQHHFRKFTEDVQISNCRLSDSRKEIGRKAGNCGVEIKDHTRRVLVSNSLSYDHADGYGFAVLVHAGRHPDQSVRHIGFVNCLAWNSIHGFAVGSGEFPVRDISITGCEAYGNRKSGLCIYAVQSGLTKSVGVTGCNFHDNQEYGIEVDGKDVMGLDLTGNRLHDNGLAGGVIADGVCGPVAGNHSILKPSCGGRS